MSADLRAITRRADAKRGRELSEAETDRHDLLEEVERISQELRDTRMVLAWRDKEFEVLSQNNSRGKHSC